MELDVGGLLIDGGGGIPDEGGADARFGVLLVDEGGGPPRASGGGIENPGGGTIPGGSMPLIT
jgi:hypothetical protein